MNVGHQRPNEHTVSEPISTMLRNGTMVSGTLWLHPSLRGSFEVAYDGMRKSDGRRDYQSVEHIRAIARTILREMAEGN